MENKERVHLEFYAGNQQFEAKEESRKLFLKLLMDASKSKYNKKEISTGVYEKIKRLIARLRQTPFSTYENEINKIADVLIFPFPEKCYPTKEDYEAKHVQYEIFKCIFCLYEDPEFVTNRYNITYDRFMSSYMPNMFKLLCRELVRHTTSKRKNGIVFDDLYTRKQQDQENKLIKYAYCVYVGLEEENN